VVRRASFFSRETPNAWCLNSEPEPTPTKHNRYGSKLDATALLQEWVRDVGAAAGLTPANTRLASGALGVPESRLEVGTGVGMVAGWLCVCLFFFVALWRRRETDHAARPH
jgi:hypothetical protein